MATDKDFLIRVRADIQQAVRQMDQLNKELGETAREGRRATQGVQPLAGAIRGVTGALGAFVSLRTAVEIVRTADAFNILDRRLRTATQATGDYVRVSTDLFRQSQVNGIALRDSVSLFQSIARIAPDLGATTDEVLTLVDSVQQLGVLSGASDQALKFGLLQFAQAMAIGVVRAEEFNSIVENIPELAQRIAKGMGVTVGELRTMTLEGRLLSEDVFRALIGQAGEINAEFEQVPDNLERAGNRLSNAWGKALSKIDQAYGVTGLLADLMNAVAEDLTTVGQDFGGRNFAEAKARVEQLRAEIAELENASLGARAFRNLVGLLVTGGSEPALAVRLRLATEELNKLEAQAARDQRGAEARFGSGSPRPDKPTPQEQAASENSQRLLEALQLQAATYGQTAEQVAIYRLQLAGASAEQIAAARAAAESIRVQRDAEAATRAKAEAEAAAARAAEAHQDKVDAVAQAAREALDPWERYREELELLEEALQQGLNPDAYRARIQAINDEINGLADTTQKSGERMSAFAEEAARGMQQAFSAHFFALLQGETDNLGARFKAMLDRMAADLVASQLLQFLLGGYGQNGSNEIGGLLGAALGGGGGEGGTVDAATGGYIRGPGTPTSDSIPARLSDGEYVVRAASVARYGVAMMDAINGGRFPALSAPRLTPAGSGFADGGLVNTGRRGGGGVVVNQYIQTPDANSFRRSEAGVGRDTAAGLSRAMRRNG